MMETKESLSEKTSHLSPFERVGRKSHLSSFLRRGWGKLLLVCLLTVISAAWVQAQETQIVQTEGTEETEQCKKLAQFLETEFKDGTKIFNDQPSERMYGLQEKDAMSRALAVCAKLKARKIKSGKEGELVYQLPDEAGKITIREVYENGIFLCLTFDTGCRSLPFTVLWFVSLKRYREP